MAEVLTKTWVTLFLYCNLFISSTSLGFNIFCGWLNEIEANVDPSVYSLKKAKAGLFLLLFSDYLPKLEANFKKLKLKFCDFVKTQEKNITSLSYRSYLRRSRWQYMYIHFQEDVYYFGSSSNTFLKKGKKKIRLASSFIEHF